MGVLDKLEQSLVDPLDKKAPFKMPPNARKGLAKALWVVTLVLGVLQLWGAWAFWNLGHYLDRATSVSVDYLNNLYGSPIIEETSLGAFYYVSLLFLVAVAALMLLATPGLKAFKKAGWNLLFYGLLLNVVYGFLRMFAEVGGGFFQFIWTVVVTAVAAYFLFQVRDQFTGKAPVEHHAAPHHSPEHKK